MDERFVVVKRVFKNLNTVKLVFLEYVLYELMYAVRAPTCSIVKILRTLFEILVHTEQKLRESPTLATFRSKIGKLNFSYYVFLAVTVANFVVLVT